MSRNNHNNKTRRTQQNRNQGAARNTRTAPTSIPVKSRTQQRAELDASESKSSLQERMGSELQGARDVLMRTGDSALQAIKANPIPIVLTGLGVVCVGAGIAWLLGSSAKALSNGENGSTRTTRTTPSAATRIAATGSAAGAKVSQLARDAAAKGRKMEQSVEDVVQEHPLAIGAALFVVGAAVGLAIPRSKLEDTWLGRESDQVISGAQKMARGAAQKVESFAKEMVGAARAQA